MCAYHVQAGRRPPTASAQSWLRKRSPRLAFWTLKPITIYRGCWHRAGRGRVVKETMSLSQRDRLAFRSLLDHEPTETRDKTVALFQKVKSKVRDGSLEARPAR